MLGLPPKAPAAIEGSPPSPQRILRIIADYRTEVLFLLLLVLLLLSPGSAGNPRNRRQDREHRVHDVRSGCTISLRLENSTDIKGRGKFILIGSPPSKSERYFIFFAFFKITMQQIVTLDEFPRTPSAVE